MRPDADPSPASEDVRWSPWAETAGVGPSRRSWGIAAAFFLGAVALVVAVLAGSHSGGNVLEGPAAIRVSGDHFNLVLGQGQPFGGAYVLESLGSRRLGILSANVQAFAADSYPRVEWQIAGTNPDAAELSFLWRTLEQPKRNFHVELESQGGLASAVLRASDGWSGTITGVALAVRGNLSQPLVVQSCAFPSVSARTAVAEIGRQWSVPFPFNGRSIALPFDAERSNYAALLVVVAVAQCLAMSGYWILARRRGWTRDPGVFWAIFLIGWLLLDARWQVNLWRQLAHTSRQFAGKTLEEKHLAADDHAVSELMQRVNAVLPAPPVRIHFLADNLALRTRGAFFLYPQNVYHDVGDRRLASPEQLRSGDYVLLFGYSGLIYEREQQQLLWPDGLRKPAEEMLAPVDRMLLLRMK